MTDERLELELRAWLTREAAAPIPPTLRAAAIAARPVAAPRTFGLRLSMPGVLAAVVLVIALATGGTLGLLGILPIGRADCGAVTIDGVLRAIEDIDGYSYRAEGTVVVNKPAQPVPTPPADPIAHEERRIVFEGAYAAPADWRITLLEGNDPLTLQPPDNLLFSFGSSIIDVDGQVWVTRRLSPVYLRLEERLEPFLQTVEPNMLRALILGADTEIGFTGDAFAWGDATTDDRLCRLHGVNERVGGAVGESEQTVTLYVDPANNLPIRVLTDISSDADEFDRIDQHLAWSVDTERPDISPPSAPGPRNLTMDEAEAMGREYGIPDAHVLAAATDGDGQVFLVGDEQRVAELVYIGGTASQTGAGDATEQVSAGVATLDGRAFLVVTVTDSRVAAVNVDLAFVADRRVRFDSVPAAYIFEVEPRVTVNRFAAFDAQGNELEDVNTPD